MSLLAIAGVIVPMAGYATDGMNLEGYGPIAAGQGGTSLAIDNGVFGAINNPATLALMESNQRYELSLGRLGPNVSSKFSGAASSDSKATAFYMPGMGWVKKNRGVVYGAGFLCQGGMGTNYPEDSFLAAGSGESVRSEVSVGRFMLPWAKRVAKRLCVGATVDYVCVGMDLKMALSGSQFLDMAGGTRAFGSVSGGMVNALNTFVAGGVLNPTAPVNWGRFDFEDRSSSTGAARGSAITGKIGLLYDLDSRFSLGMVYHEKARMSDLKTADGLVRFNANVDAGIAAGGAPTSTYFPTTIPLRGSIRVRNFDWPRMIGFGLAYKASDRVKIAADYRWINWVDTMDSFKLSFTADPNQPGMAAGFSGTTIDAVLPQNWKNQNVFKLGASLQRTPELILRSGVSLSSNPIPDKYMHPLFPATIETQYSFGAGYSFKPGRIIDVSFVYAPKVSVTNGYGVNTSHGQFNCQVMLSRLL
ncbi:MAG: outer membrane protein transport protein [Candidatus Ozemobacteraceae bacterium]